MMAGEQPALISRMNRLARVITIVASIAGVSLLASAGVWAYIGLYRSRVGLTGRAAAKTKFCAAS